MSCDYLSRANKGISKLQPYQAGKPIEELERELGIKDIIKLASNENPLGFPASAKQAITKHLDELTFYPDANGFSLKKAISEKFKVKQEQITLGNGSNDLIELIARTFVHDEDEVIFAQYAFIVYPLVTQALNAKAVVVPAKNWGHDLPAMLAAITDKTKLVVVANPNNPTGTFLESAELEQFIKQVPENVLVVLDEAYTEFTPVSRRAPSLQWVDKYPNLIVCRTFSKAYGLAGLRIGYAVSSPEIMGILNRVRQPFNCNSLALVAAEAVLADDAYLAKAYENNLAGLKLITEFCEQEKLPYIPSMGNFITIDFGKPAQPIYQQLLQKGVIVRPIAGYGMPNHLRISIGLPEQNQRLINGLKEILN
ncbi:histidinol-phosphate transaminase [Zophobihabitans entericus]|uniref:Histidinol-phosphate aminotransferase n=1 Tax=Zophobihabitans entericus TaxID=1635327 RepID=A0A6G9IBP9_9GAMM|nr:histidinol-phosphate transaminase [Zophobihabitans entericus]QIQ21658.1 histidinol-phosphate transaminase [Zophobihabitans entericus]